LTGLATASIVETVDALDKYGFRFRGPSRPGIQEGFTLVEVALALGIIGFAFTAIMGLVPIGLCTARNAAETSVCSQIVQRVAGDLKQTDFNALDSGTTESFDDQANMLASSSAAGKIYDVQVQLYSVLLPGSTTANPNLACAKIIIADNPGNVANPFSGGVPFTKTYSAYIARASASSSGSPTLLTPPSGG